MCARGTSRCAIFFLILVLGPASAAAEGSIADGLIPEWEPRGELDRIYFEALRGEAGGALDVDAAWRVSDLVVELDGLTVTFTDGEFFPRTPVEGHVFGAVYVGSGRWQFSPDLVLEQDELERLTGERAMDAEFTDALLQFAPHELERFLVDPQPAAGDRKTRKAALKLWKKARPAQHRVVLDHDLVAARFLVEGIEHMESLRIDAEVDDVRSTVESKVEGKPRLLYRFRGEDPEEVGLYRYRVNPVNATDHRRETLCHFPRQRDRETLSRRELAYKDSSLIDVEHYLGEFKLVGDEEQGGRILEAEVVVQLRSTFRDLRVVPLALVGGHEEPESEWERRVKVRGVLSHPNGEMLPFVHSQGVLYVELPEPLAADETIQLKAVYEGDLVSGYRQMDLETLSGVRLGHYSLLNTYPWYPQNSRYAFDRYTFHWKFAVPKNMEVASSGTTQFDAVLGDWRNVMIYEENPSTHASVILGEFSVLEPKEDLHPRVRVFCHPTQLDAGAEILGEAVRILAFYEDLFGAPYPYPELDIAQMAYGMGFAQAPPGLVQMDGAAFLSKTLLVTRFNVSDPIIRELFLPHEIAHQWWAHLVGSRTDHDYWIMESLCEYSSALYREAVHGPEGYERYLKHWRIERAAQNTNRTTSLWLSATGRDRRRYVATAYARGPLVFHELRTQFGTDKVVNVMRALVAEYRGEEICTEDLKMVLEKATGLAFDEYFDLYVYGNAPLGQVPEDADQDGS